jgi:hypothetical protein
MLMNQHIFTLTLMSWQHFVQNRRVLFGHEGFGAGSMTTHRLYDGSDNLTRRAKMGSV